MNSDMKKKIGIAVILSMSITIALYLYWRLPYDWKEKTLFPINLPNVKTTAVTNHTDDHVFSEKIWLHRVNSIERLKIMEEKYKGLEIDIIWDTDSAHLYVAHDPDPEIIFPLSQMFDNVKDINKHYFWLDFKNIDEENAVLALEYLVKLVDKHKITHKNVIVESMNPYLLSNFTTAGFSTSYYLWEFNPYAASDKEVIDYAKNIDAMLLKSNVNYISSDYLSYRFIKKYFPDSQMLLWHLKDNKITSYVRKKIVGDDHVKVILVHEYSEGYR